VLGSASRGILGRTQRAYHCIESVHALRHVAVGVRLLDRRQSAGPDAEDFVNVLVAIGLHPGRPRPPGAVTLVLFPAQQLPDGAGHLHQRRRPRRLCSHRASIRNLVRLVQGQRPLVRRQGLRHPSGSHGRRSQPYPIQPDGPDDGPKSDPSSFRCRSGHHRGAGRSVARQMRGKREVRGRGPTPRLACCPPSLAAGPNTIRAVWADREVAHRDQSTRQAQRQQLQPLGQGQPAHA
jgi:hypothetical protein